MQQKTVSKAEHKTSYLLTVSPRPHIMGWIGIVISREFYFLVVYSKSKSRTPRLDTRQMNLPPTTSTLVQINPGVLPGVYPIPRGA